MRRPLFEKPLIIRILPSTPVLPILPKIVPPPHNPLIRGPIGKQGLSHTPKHNPANNQS
jgi:hypothetical protein